MRGTPDNGRAFFPAAGGYRFFTLTLLPNANYDFLTDVDIEERDFRGMDEKMPGLRDHSRSQTIPACIGPTPLTSKSS